MSILLALLTFAVFVGISYFSERMKKEIASKADLEVSLGARQAAGAAAPSPLPAVVLPSVEDGWPRVEGYRMPEGLYYHQGHMWVAQQEAGAAVIGIDEFVGKLIGKPDSIKLPRVGKRYKQGEKILSFRREDKRLDLVCPVDGEVIAINGRAIESPAVLTREPYGAGWLVMLKTRDMKRNLRNLLSGQLARSWMEDSASKLRAMFAGSLGVVYGDGGLPQEGLADHFEAEDWNRLVKQIFMVEHMDDPIS